MTKEKSVLITGVTSGLGAFLARSFVERGWRVLGCGRKESDHVSIPSGISYLRADLSKSDEVVNLVRDLSDVPDLVVHSAVTYPRPSSDRSNSLESTFQVNSFAPYQLSLELIARAHENRPMSMIFLNSEAIYNADGSSCIYAASKAALRVLAAGLAHMCRGTNIGVSTLILGPLANEVKLKELEELSQRKGVDIADLRKMFLRRSNPNLVIDDFIDFQSCAQMIHAVFQLGRTANGMVSRLDGGASGSLN